MQFSKLMVVGHLAMAILGVVIVPQVRAQERLEHLLVAAEHLEKAGLPDQAAEIRTLADAELRAHGPQLLQQKLAQQEALQKEIDRLQQAIAPAPRIRLRLNVYEYRPSKLDESGLGLVSLRQLLSHSTPTSFVDESGKVSEFIEFLQKQGLVQARTTPVLVTRDGVPASVFMGEERTRDKEAGASSVATVSPESPAAGFRFDCTPQVRDGHNVRLAIRLRQSEPRDDNGDRTDASKTPDVSMSFQFNTQVDLVSGQTLIVGGMKSQAPGAEETGMLVLLGAEILDSASASSTPK
jgi:Flp pilus assembly secretin CpaC